MRGNRNPKPKLPLEEKSQKWQFWLDPKKPDDAWAIDAAYQKMRDNNWTVQELFKQGLSALFNKKRPDKEVFVSGVQINDIQERLDWIIEQIQSGKWVMSEQETKRKGKRTNEIEINEILKPTLERYIDDGYVPEDD